MIGWTIYICFLGVLLLTIIPRENHRAIRIFALLTAIASLVIGVVGTLHYSPNPSGAATVAKLALYSFIGSAMILVVLLAAYVVSGAKTFNLVELSKFQFPVAFQMWALPLMLAGFGILAGLWPFHTWAPTGHVAAPTAASMLLAGVVMKLGAYGALRVAMTLFPRGLDDWVSRFHGLESWREVFSVLAVVGIVYGAMVAL